MFADISDCETDSEEEIDSNSNSPNENVVPNCKQPSQKKKFGDKASTSNVTEIIKYKKTDQPKINNQISEKSNANQIKNKKTINKNINSNARSSCSKTQNKQNNKGHNNNSLSKKNIIAAAPKRRKKIPVITFEAEIQINKLNWKPEEKGIGEKEVGDKTNLPIPDILRCSICYCNGRRLKDHGEVQESDFAIVDQKISNTGITICKFCSVAVHTTCYGIKKRTDKKYSDWACRRCSKKPKSVNCCLCSKKGGAFWETTNEDQWIHSSCAIWTPEVYWEPQVNLKDNEVITRDFDKLFDGPVFGLEEIEEDRKSLKCRICKLKYEGNSCIQCANGKCRSAFHVGCAQAKGPIHYLWDNFPRFSSLLAYCSQNHNHFKFIGEDDSARIVNIKLGTRVMAKYKDGSWYKAIIIELIETCRWAIHFPSTGMIEMVKKEHLQIIKTPDGSNELGPGVEVRVENPVYGYEGTCLSLTSQYSFRVRFEDRYVSIVKLCELLTAEEWKTKKPESAVIGICGDANSDDENDSSDSVSGSDFDPFYFKHKKRKFAKSTEESILAGSSNAKKPPKKPRDSILLMGKKLNKGQEELSHPPLARKRFSGDVVKMASEKANSFANLNFAYSGIDNAKLHNKNGDTLLTESKNCNVNSVEVPKKESFT